MRRLINYFRQVFCKHDFESEDSILKREGNFRVLNGTVRYMYCKKCGYHSNHWKFMI